MFARELVQPQPPISDRSWFMGPRLTDNRVSLKDQFTPVANLLAENALHAKQVLAQRLKDTHYSVLGCETLDIPPSATQNMFALTDPWQIINRGAPLFTVTSTLVLDGLLDGTGLLPAVQLPRGELHASHNGAWVTYFPIISRALGIGIESADQFVWLAPEPEAEHLRLIELRNQLHPTSTNDVHELIFDLPSSSDHPRIRRELAQILRELQAGRNPSENQELVQYIDHFLETAVAFGLRGTWLDILSGVLHGSRHPRRVWDPTMLQDILFNQDIDFRRTHRDIAYSPIIIQVDPEIMLDQMPIYLVPFTSRPLGPLVPSRWVSPSAVEAIFATNPRDIPNAISNQFEVRDIAEFPQEQWLRDDSET